jgi:ATP-dependent Lon protease
MTKRKGPPPSDESDNSDNDSANDNEAQIKELFSNIFGLNSINNRNNSLNNTPQDNIIVFKNKKPPVKQSKKKMTEKEQNAKMLESYLSLTTNDSSCSDLAYFNSELNLEQKGKIINELTKIQNDKINQKPRMIQLIESNIPIQFKKIAINKIIQLENGKDTSGKLEQWVDTFLKIPFQSSSTLPLTISDGSDKCKDFMEKCQVTLDSCTYGMNDVKNQLLQLIGKWIVNPKSMGTAIALKGPMGTGKTTLIKNGISKILNRPFAFIALGGASDGSFLEGHSFTYEGSMYGKIVDILIQSKSNNPVIFFDELDKVSQCERGQEIIGVLTHLTDSTQNSQFHDKYFSEIDFDLSKCLFVFSYNEEHKVNPILKDRMYSIEVNGYNKKEKNIIAFNYLLPEIMKEYNMDSVEFDNRVIDYIINNIEQEEGVRCLKRSLETICSKINLKRIIDLKLAETKWIVSTEDVDEMLKISKEKIIKPFMNMYL